MGGDTTIRSNDIWQGLPLVEHLDEKRRGQGYFAVPLSFFYAALFLLLMIKMIDSCYYRLGGAIRNTSCFL